MDDFLEQQLHIHCIDDPLNADFDLCQFAFKNVKPSHSDCIISSWLSCNAVSMSFDEDHMLLWIMWGVLSNIYRCPIINV